MYSTVQVYRAVQYSTSVQNRFLYLAPGHEEHRHSAGVGLLDGLGDGGDVGHDLAVHLRIPCHLSVSIVADVRPFVRLSVMSLSLLYCRSYIAHSKAGSLRLVLDDHHIKVAIPDGVLNNHHQYHHHHHHLMVFSMPLLT